MTETTIDEVVSGLDRVTLQKAYSRDGNLFSVTLDGEYSSLISKLSAENKKKIESELSDALKAAGHPPDSVLYYFVKNTGPNTLNIFTHDPERAVAIASLFQNKLSERYTGIASAQPYTMPETALTEFVKGLSRVSFRKLKNDMMPHCTVDLLGDFSSIVSDDFPEDRNKIISQVVDGLKLAGLEVNPKSMDFYSKHVHGEDILGFITTPKLALAIASLFQNKLVQRDKNRGPIGPQSATGPTSPSR